MLTVWVDVEGDVPPIYLPQVAAFVHICPSCRQMTSGGIKKCSRYLVVLLVEAAGSGWAAGRVDPTPAWILSSSALDCWQQYDGRYFLCILEKMEYLLFFFIYSGEVSAIFCDWRGIYGEKER